MSPHRWKRRIPRKPGRPKNDRVRAMRFVLWALQFPPRALTAKQIAGVMNMTPQGARNWRRDFLKALSPVQIDGIPRFLTPTPIPAFESPSPAATGTTSSDERTTP